VIPHELTTFYAKRDSTQTYVSSFFIVKPSLGKGMEHTARMYFATLSEIPHGFTPSRGKMQSEIQFKIITWFELRPEIIAP